MTDSNRVRLAYVREVTLGTTPNSPAMKKIRMTGESLNYEINNIRSEEISADRLTPDLIQVGARNSGGFNGELSYGSYDDFIEGVMFNSWVKTPEKYNATSDSSITGVTDSSDTFAVDAGGASFKLGHLIRTSGFTNAANNGLFRVASSTATTVVVGGTPTLTDEAAPPAGAQIKVVGFRGASGDITALADGIGSTALDFTTLGLAVGQWIKTGGSTSGEQFSAAELNDWMRITAISATKLTCDNLPTGWTTNSGTGKTITVYFGDVLKIGTTKQGFTIEKGFLEQAVPTYIAYRGCVVGTMALTLRAQAIASTAFTILGLTGAVTTTALDAGVDDVSTADVMNCVADVGRMSEAGSVVASPNQVMELSLNINNNLRDKTAIGVLGNFDIGAGDAVITGSMNTYFGSKALYEKFIAGTASSLSVRVSNDNQGYVFTLPRIKYESGAVNASGRNQDVMANLGFTALKDTVTETSLQIDRFVEFA